MTKAPTYHISLNIPADSIVIGMAGRIHFWKGQSYFIDIAKAFYDSRLNPTIKEMCVNASNQNDNTWGKVKKEILLETRDITQVWNLNQKHIL